AGNVKDRTHARMGAGRIERAQSRASRRRGREHTGRTVRRLALILISREEEAAVAPVVKRRSAFAEMREVERAAQRARKDVLRAVGRIAAPPDVRSQRLRVSQP